MLSPNFGHDDAPSYAYYHLSSHIATRNNHSHHFLRGCIVLFILIEVDVPSETLPK